MLIGAYTLSYSLLVVPEWSRGGHGENRTLAGRAGGRAGPYRTAKPTGRSQVSYRLEVMRI